MAGLPASVQAAKQHQGPDHERIPPNVRGSARVAMTSGRHSVDDVVSWSGPRSGRPAERLLGDLPRLAKTLAVELVGLPPSPTTSRRRQGVPVRHTECPADVLVALTDEVRLTSSELVDFESAPPAGRSKAQRRGVTGPRNLPCRRRGRVLWRHRLEPVRSPEPGQRPRQAPSRTTIGHHDPDLDTDISAQLLTVKSLHEARRPSAGREYQASPSAFRAVERYCWSAAYAQTPCATSNSTATSWTMVSGAGRPVTRRSASAHPRPYYDRTQASSRSATFFHAASTTMTKPLRGTTASPATSGSTSRRSLRLRTAPV